MNCLGTTHHIYKEAAVALATLSRAAIFISESTFHYDGGGCC